LTQPDNSFARNQASQKFGSPSVKALPLRAEGFGGMLHLDEGQSLAAGKKTKAIKSLFFL